MCTYKYKYREVFCKCVFVSWKKKSGRGDWGEGAAPPPKAEWQYLFSQAILHAKTQRLPQSRMTIPIFTSKATSKTSVYILIFIYLFIDVCVYIYIYIGEFNASASLCLEKTKSGRGDWGEGAAPPPKQNDKTYFHKQCYRQKHLHMSLYIFFV